GGGCPEAGAADGRTRGDPGGVRLAVLSAIAVAPAWRYRCRSLDPFWVEPRLRSWLSVDAQLSLMDDALSRCINLPTEVPAYASPHAPPTRRCAGIHWSQLYGRPCYTGAGACHPACMKGKYV